jgi:hypothetical protein
MTALEALDLVKNEYNLPNFEDARGILKQIYNLEVSASMSGIENYGKTADWITYRVKEIMRNGQ